MDYGQTQFESQKQPLTFYNQSKHMNIDKLRLLGFIEKLRSTINSQFQLAREALQNAEAHSYKNITDKVKEAEKIIIEIKKLHKEYLKTQAQLDKLKD